MDPALVIWCQKKGQSYDTLYKIPFCNRLQNPGPIYNVSLCMKTLHRSYKLLRLWFISYTLYSGGRNYRFNKFQHEIFESIGKFWYHQKKDIYDLTILHPGITHQGREQVGPDSTSPYIFSEGRSWDLLILTPMVSTNVALKTHLSETS